MLTQPLGCNHAVSCNGKVFERKPYKVKSAYTFFTPRERQVACMLASGMMEKEVAANLNLSVKTIQKFVADIYIKLKIDNRSSLTHYVLFAGWIPNNFEGLRSIINERNH